jgi:hypothetical protein
MYRMSWGISLEPKFRASIVQLILNGKVEEALGLLAKHYGASVPKIKVGLPKRYRIGKLGCYIAESQTIHVVNGDMLEEPFVILHEFYHHLRTSIDKKHKGTEDYADKFAREYVEAYRFLNARVARSSG